MPKKKDYGPPTRRLDRRTQRFAEPTAPLPDDEDNKQLSSQTEQGALTAEGRRELPLPPNPQDLPLPTIEGSSDDPSSDFLLVHKNKCVDSSNQLIKEEEMASQSPAPGQDTQNNANIESRLDALEALIRRSLVDTAAASNAGQARSATPYDSAFGGVSFQPSGAAMREGFAPFTDPPDPKAENEQYDEKAKARGNDPSMFSGDEGFDTWVVELDDKFMEDVKTYRTERSRMAYMMTRLEGDAKAALSPRYNKGTFRCVAEMVQVLSASYHDPNRTSAARQKLASMRFKLGDSIHKFIADFNATVQEANVAPADFKMTLWEHIPASLDPRLLRDSKDSTVSYEDFCSLIADAAFSNQKAFEDRKRNRPSKDTSDPGSRSQTRDTQRNNARGPRQQSNSFRCAPSPARVGTAPPNRQQARRALTPAELDAHRAAGTCYTCGERGHRAADCPAANKAVHAVSTERETVGDECSGDSGNE